MRTVPSLAVAALLAALATPSLAQNVVSTIAFSSQRDDPAGEPRINTNEIYLIDYQLDGTFTSGRRLTVNTDADFFPAVSPDGRGRIVFDSNRLRFPEEPINTSDLFLMNHDGSEQMFLTRGGSPSWSPPAAQGGTSKWIAFHASASGVGLPVNPFPGSATADSDIFVVNVDEVQEGGAVPWNLTNDPLAVDDDPDWSPDGQKIVFTSHPVTDGGTNAPNAEIYVVSPDGSDRAQLTFNSEEERAPAWSPDGALILFLCRKGVNGSFEICVMNADGTGQTRLTFDGRYLTPTWSPDGQQIVFHKGGENQLWTMQADGTGRQRITAPPGFNFLATAWDVITVGQGQNK
jgi:TolB protein